MFSVPYEHHFGLKAKPFSTAPDPRYLYMSTPHKEALAHLLYGLGTDGGFVLLTGEAGTGKTTVCRCLLDELPENVDVACIDDPQVSIEALLAGACRGFWVETDAQATVERQVHRLETFLLANHARGRHSVLMFDEAHRLSVDVLEQRRLLTNLDTHERKAAQHAGAHGVAPAFAAHRRAVPSAPAGARGGLRLRAAPAGDRRRACPDRVVSAGPRGPMT